MSKLFYFCVLFSLFLCIHYVRNQTSLESGSNFTGLDALRKIPPRIFTLLQTSNYRDLLPELYEQIPRPPAHTKTVVVGSGFGGSVAALRLAEAQIPTTVLERGQDWPTDTWREINTYEPLRDGRGFWHKSSVRTPIVAKNAPRLPVGTFGGVLDITEYPNMEVWRGACVGGGSKVFTGVMVQPRKEYFEEIFSELVSYSEMDEVYYPRVKNMLNLSPIPQDLYESEPWGNSRVWDEQARNAGYEVSRPDSNFNWDIVRAELRGESQKSATIGLSNMGNSNGAKYDTTQNYLRLAKESGFVRVYPNQHVRDIEELKDGYIVHIDKLTPDGDISDRYSITCDFLILSAGSIGTTELLLKAREKGLISGLSEEIGKGWGSNGDSIVTRSFNSIRGRIQGSPCSSMIHDASMSAPTTFESWYVPGIPVDVGIVGTLGMTYDRFNRGAFVYDRDNDLVKLEWNSTASDLTVFSAREMNNRLRDAHPKSRPGVPILAPDIWAGFTAHPLGGATLGRATDAFGRVKGRSRLYVMDGAVIPGSTGAVNPSLTISALVERNIERVIRHDFSESAGSSMRSVLNGTEILTKR